MTRRGFLAASGAAGVAVALSPGSSGAQVSTTGGSGTNEVETVDTLVIGTGYGGAVAARRLSAAGRSVVMLEMGQRWDTPGPDGLVFNKLLSPDWRSTWHRTRTQMPLQSFLWMDIANKNISDGPGVLDKRSLGFMNVYLGRGVGGGSLVNGGMAPRPKRSTIGRELPMIDIDRFFSTYLPRAEAELGVNSIRPGFRDTTKWYQFSRTGAKTAKSVGYPVVDVPNVYDFAYMEAEAAGTVQKSALDGQVIFGNDRGKKDLTKTYLARAEATGRVQIRTGRRASTIAVASNGDYDVTVETLGFDGSVTAVSTLRAHSVYLAGGSVGTTELLLRSRAAGGLTDLSSEVGRFWGPNGNTMFGRANHMWDPTGTSQSTIPVQSVDLWETATPCFTELAPMPAGTETWAQLYLSIADNPARASFGLSGDTLALDWTPSHSDRAVQIVDSAFSKINAKQGTVYRSDLFGDTTVFSRNFTYHPLGGAALGRVTDDYGRVSGHPRLYVTDGSLIPGMTGVNPFLTITALAERLMEDVLAKGS